MKDQPIPTTLSNFGRGTSSSSLQNQEGSFSSYEPPSASGPIVGGAVGAPSSPGGNVGGTLSPRPTDILCGRGCSTHHGNAVFRSVVRRHQPQYHASSKAQKVELARCIVRAVATLDPPGRFLEKSKNDGLYYEIEPRKALEKTKQALRERYNMKEDDDEYGMEEGDPAVEALERTLARAEAEAKAGLLPNDGTGGGGGGRRGASSPRPAAPQAGLSPANADAAAGKPFSAGFNGNIDVPMPPLVRGGQLPAPSTPPAGQRPAFRPPRSVSQRPSLVNFFFNVPSRLTNLTPQVSGGSARSTSGGSKQAQPAATSAESQAGVSFSSSSGKVHFASSRSDPQAPSASSSMPPHQRRQAKRSSVVDLFRGSISHFVGVEDQLMNAVFRRSTVMAGGGRAGGGVPATAAAAAAAVAAAEARGSLDESGRSSSTFGASDQGGGTGLGEDDAVLAGIEDTAGGDPFADSSSKPGSRRSIASYFFGNELGGSPSGEVGSPSSGKTGAPGASRRKSRSGSMLRSILRFSTPLNDAATRKLLEETFEAAEREEDEKKSQAAALAAKKEERDEDGKMPAAAIAVGAELDSAKRESATQEIEGQPSAKRRKRRQSSFNILSLLRPDPSQGAGDDGAAASSDPVDAGRRKSVFQFMQLLGKSDLEDKDALKEVFADAVEQECADACVDTVDSTTAATVAAGGGGEGENAGPTSSASSPSKGGEGTSGGRRRSSIFESVIQWGSDMMGEGWGDFVSV